MQENAKQWRRVTKDQANQKPSGRNSGNGGNRTPNIGAGIDLFDPVSEMAKGVSETTGKAIDGETETLNELNETGRKMFDKNTINDTDKEIFEKLCEEAGKQRESAHKYIEKDMLHKERMAGYWLQGLKFICGIAVAGVVGLVAYRTTEKSS